jgi:CRISPR-associated endonuclease Csn1
MDKPVRLTKNFGIKQANLIVNPSEKIAVKDHLAKFDNNPLLAFDSKNLKKEPLVYKDHLLKEVICFEEIFTIRKEVNPLNFKDQKLINKVIDAKTRKLLSARLKECGGDAKKAFSDLDKKPIWLNEAVGIALKRVAITGVSNVEALHSKKDHFGNEITDLNGKAIPADFVSTGNNHHVAIFKDEKGNLQEEVVSFYEAVARSNQNESVIRKVHPEHPQWEFQFTMKQNEYFVFPNENLGFDLANIDLTDETKAAGISPNLFRVQKFTGRDYFFRHHLETTIENNNKTKGITWRREGLNGINDIIKVCLNHLGQIVKVGEE